MSVITTVQILGTTDWEFIRAFGIGFTIVLGFFVAWILDYVDWRKGGAE